MARTATRPVHSTWNATVRTMLGATAVVTLVLLAFAWPTYTAKVKDMPIAVVASDQQRTALDQQLAAAGGAFDVESVADRAAAVDAIERRETYGAVVLPAAPGGAVEVLTASAGSMPATQMLTGAAQKMGAAQAQAAVKAKQEGAANAARLGAQAAAAQATAGTLKQTAAALAADPTTAARAAAMQPQIAAAGTKAAQLGAQAKAAQSDVASTPVPTVKVTDVVPLSAKDSRGTGFAVAGLPIVMGGMIGGVMISTLVVGWKRRLVAVAGYGVLGGLTLTLILHSWFGFVQGSFAFMWAALGLAIAATAAFITGVHALIGGPGIAVGAVTTLFIGNPISSMQSPKEWLPGPWGEIGQLFVPGAAGSLMRIESYFPRASTTEPWLVLLAWFTLGVVLNVIGRHKNDELIHIEGAVEPDPV